MPNYHDDMRHGARKFALGSGLMITKIGNDKGLKDLTPHPPTLLLESSLLFGLFSFPLFLLESLLKESDVYARGDLP